MLSKGRLNSMRERLVVIASVAREREVDPPLRSCLKCQSCQHSWGIAILALHTAKISRKSRGAPLSTRATILLVIRSSRLSNWTSVPWEEI